MEFNEIVVKESPGLCRCCLSEGCYKDLGSEYNWMNETEIYADMLLECFDISITQHNEGPNGPNRLICEVCITRLRDACNFKKQVLDSEKKFIDMVARGEFRPKMLVYQANMKAEDTLEAPSEDGDGEVEFLEEEINFGDDETVKDESEEPSASNITVTTLPIKSKRGRPPKTSALIKPEKKIKVAKFEDKPRTSKAVPKGPKKDPKKYSANHLRRRNLQILFNNTTLVPFKWRGKYLCFYCGEDFDKHDVLIMHTKSHGLCTEQDRAIKLVKSPDSEIKIDVSIITCHICEESFAYFNDIVTHLMAKHNQPYDQNVELMITPYRLVDLRCLLCENTFDYFSKLVTHMNIDHPSNCYLCSECYQKFNKKRDLDAHMRTHHKKDYSCVRCKQNFTSNNALQKHRIKDHISSCNICFKTFSTVNKRLRHMRIDHTSDQTQCGFCYKTLSTKQAFLRHAAKCVGKDSKIIVPDDDAKKHTVKELRNSIATILNMSTALPFKFYMNRFRCFYCSKDFLTCDELKEHTVVEHPLCDITIKSMKLRNRYDGVQIKIDTSSLSCKLCYVTLHDLCDLLQHLTTEHKAHFEESVISHMQSFKLFKENFACPFCGEVYRYFGLLLKHVSTSHTDNKYICVYCGKSFRTDPNLRAHVSRRHKDVGRYKCKNCDLVFPTNNALKRHMGGTHGKKFVKCPKCPDKFTSQYWMQIHMLTSHGTGHKCNYCGKLFIKNSFMVNHIRRLHLKEKNVECPVCFDRFFDGQRLKMHMVKHVGERNFHCDICGKKFLWKRNLRGHMTSHVRAANTQTINT